MDVKEPAHKNATRVKETEKCHVLTVTAEKGFLVRIANNPYIFSMVEMLQAHVRRLYYYEKINLREQSIKQHQELIQLFKDKEVSKLTEVMRANWIYTIEEF